MKTTTYEPTVENGQIKLLDTVHLPEHAKVFIGNQLFADSALAMRNRTDRTRRARMNGNALRQVFEIPVVGSEEVLRISGFQQNDFTVKKEAALV